MATKHTYYLPTFDKLHGECLSPELEDLFRQRYIKETGTNPSKESILFNNDGVSSYYLEDKLEVVLIIGRTVTENNKLVIKYSVTEITDQEFLEKVKELLNDH